MTPEERTAAALEAWPALPEAVAASFRPILAAWDDLQRIYLQWGPLLRDLRRAEARRVHSAYRARRRGRW